MLQTSELTLQNKYVQLSKLRATNKRLKKSTLCDPLSSFQYRSSASKTLVRMQVHHRRNTNWHKKEKEFAISLYYKSPSAYKHLVRQGIVLPSVSTIRTWLGTSKFNTGFNALLFDQIKIKVDAMQDDEKVCTICFDEMALKKCKEYSKDMDFTEGWEDLGQLGRFQKSAQEALVFMARGIYSKWKIPLAYFVSANGVKHDNLKLLIEQTLTEVKKVGLIPKAIICDQGANNRSALKDLGISVDKPFFIHEGQKVFALYDMLNGTLLYNVL